MQVEGVNAAEVCQTRRNRCERGSMARETDHPTRGHDIKLSDGPRDHESSQHARKRFRNSVSKAAVNFQADTCERCHKAFRFDPPEQKYFHNRGTCSTRGNRGKTEANKGNYLNDDKRRSTKSSNGIEPKKIVFSRSAPWCEVENTNYPVGNKRRRFHVRHRDAEVAAITLRNDFSSRCRALSRVLVVPTCFTDCFSARRRDERVTARPENSPDAIDSHAKKRREHDFIKDSSRGIHLPGFP